MLIRRMAMVGTVIVAALLLGTGPQAFASSARPTTTHSVAADGALGPFGPLVDLVIQRVELGDQVAAAKFGTGQPIDDPVREAQELAAVRSSAVSLGIDPDAAVAFFADQISASKIVQRGLFAYWTDHPDQAPTTRPDLGTLRTELDALTTELLNQLVATNDLRDPSLSCTAQLLAAKLSGEIIDGLDALHRHAVDDALHSVCIA